MVAPILTEDTGQAAPERPDLAAIRARYGDDVGTGMERVVRLEYLGEQARDDVPALLGLVEQQAATIARYDTALIEATRDAEADDDGQPTRRSLIETAEATDAERDRLEAELADARAEIERLRADRNRMHLALARERHERAEAAEWPDDPAGTAVVEIVPDPSGLLAALRSTVETRDASHAPESPADAPDPSGGDPNAPPDAPSPRHAPPRPHTRGPRPCAPPPSHSPPHSQPSAPPPCSASPPAPGSTP
jgi:hypothetical protein